MVWYPAYLDKQDIVDWVSKQSSRLTTGDILSVDLRMADLRIFAALDDEDIQVNYTGTVSGCAIIPADRNSYLWGASLCFNLEQMGYQGENMYTPGGLASTKVGGVQHEFMRMQPMFFLGQGDLANMDKVMPFQSYKQLGQWLIQRWINRYILDRDGTRVAVPVVGFDNTSRGYGWNADLSFISGADANSSGLM